MKRAQRRQVAESQLSFGSAVRNLVASVGNLFVSAGEALGGIGQMSESEAENAIDEHLGNLARQDLTRRVKPSKRRYVMGLGLQSAEGKPIEEVKPGETAVLFARPQIAFRPEQILLDSETARSFQVTDIRVGKNSQLPSANEISGEFFAANNPSPIKLSCDLIQVSMDVAILLRNKTGDTQKISGALVGVYDEEIIQIG